MKFETVDTVVRSKLNQSASSLEKILKADVMSIDSPILYGLELTVRRAIELRPAHNQNLAIILNTVGGVVEVVERMVDMIRHFYKDVTFVIPDRAMSAGTIFAMSGDRIMMDYFSCLGPIDPQIQKDDGSLLPALSYLTQFQRMVDKAKAGVLTNADVILLNKLDLAELHKYEQARELSITLLKKWLTRFKFKNWRKTRTRGVLVTEKMKEDRAKEIAEHLNKTEKWHSHARGIGMAVLQQDLNLEIEDFGASPKLQEGVRMYHALLRDYMNRYKLFSFVHTKEFF